MNANIKRGALAAVLFAVAFFASAQNVDHKILGIESGVVYGYDVSSGDIGYGGSLALGLTLTDNLAAGIVFMNGDGTGLPATANLLSLSYGFADKVGTTVYLGSSGATMLSGFGLYYNIFERKAADALGTVLKTKIDYLFDPSAGIDAGDLTLSLAVSVGL